MSVSFADHVTLVDRFLDARDSIVERIESALLNVQGKDLLRQRDRRVFERALVDGFFGAPGVPRDAIRLKDELTSAHVADGFEPMALERFPNELDPVQLIGRAYRYWDQTRWPGKSGRLSYARAIVSVVILRRLEALGLRIWDESSAAVNLREIQRLLDRVNESQTTVFVRDARWLIHTAQGPVTRGVAAYFNVATQIDDGLDAADRLETHRAGAVLTGGHLRSQLRYTAARLDTQPDDAQTLGATRNSNSMDSALLVRDLVGLLEAYEESLVSKSETRPRLVDAILQGLSADPELLLTRLDLLEPYIVMEELAASRNEDNRAHLGRYAALIGRLSGDLLADAAAFDPSRSAYSPYAVTYGFVSDVLANIAIGVLWQHETYGLALEDMFESRDRLDEKLARARGWEAFPAREGEQAHFTHSGEWGQAAFARLTSALTMRAERAGAANASRHPDARLFVVSESGAGAGRVPSGAVNANEHCFASDGSRAQGFGYTAWPARQMSEDRREGRFLASAESEGGWFGVSKFILTVCLAQGQHAVVTGVPAAVADRLRQSAPGVVS